MKDNVTALEKYLNAKQFDEAATVVDAILKTIEK